MLVLKTLIWLVLIKNNMKYHSTQKGFTLVEMIVSLAIFAIVAVVAVGALLKVTDANKKSQTLKTAINNLNFALESMSREMRVGANYAAGSAIGDIRYDGATNVVEKQGGYISAGNPWVVAFNTSKTVDDGSGGVCNLINAYRYDPTAKTIMKAEQEACGGELVFHQLVSQDVVITESILNVISSDLVRPKAFFWFKGYTGEKERNKTEFELQTTVSQRVGT